MKKIHRAVKGDRSTGFSIAMGIAAALVVTVVLTAGLTSLVVNGKVEVGMANIFVFVIRLLSVLIGCLIGAVFGKEKPLQIMGLSAAGYLIVILGFGIILYDGTFQNFGVGLLSVVVGALIACIIKLKSQSKRNKALRHIR